jgi:hypothetical protein
MILTLIITACCLWEPAQTSVDAAKIAWPIESGTSWQKKVRAPIKAQTRCRQAPCSGTDIAPSPISGIISDRSGQDRSDRTQPV